MLLRIGQSYQGGKIFYIDGTGQHGLIAATSDQSTGNLWYNGNWSGETGANATWIGSGLSNTNTIIASQGAGSGAADLARTYNGGGYTDWYLPSLDELIELYNNKTAIGGFSDDGGYWSSSECGEYAAFFASFGSVYLNGSCYYNMDFKNSSRRVRAIRTF